MKQTIHAIVNKDGRIVFNAVTLTSSMPEHDAWCKFFRTHANQVPMGEAEDAYKAIGYRCVKFELVEVPLGG